MEDRETVLDFRSEALEHLEAVEAAILELEHAPEERQVELIAASFRAVHSIKGVASFIGLTAVQQVSHKMEDLFDKVRSGSLAFVPAMGPPLLAGLDVLRQLIEPLPDEMPDVPIEPVLAQLLAIEAAPAAEDESGAGPLTVSVRDVSSLSKAAQLAAELRAALEQRREVVLDVSAAGFVHTGVLQVLCAFAADARSRAVPVRWSERDPAFGDCVRWLGMESALFG